MDVSTSPLLMPPGRLMAAMNYEPVQEGYRRLDGIERYDGNSPPSSARFWTLPFRNGVMAPAVGQIVTGNMSHATGTIMALAHLDEGLWNNSSAAGHLALRDVAGSFTEGEYLYINGVLIGTVAGGEAQDYAPTVALILDYTALAQDARRNDVGRVPGSGPVRGVVIFDGVAYAFRDNADGTAGAMYRATLNGWQLVNPGRWIRFTAGLSEIADGDRIYGATSGASATAARVVRQSGNWGSTAAGYIVLTDLDGAFGAESLTANGHASATTAADTAITLPAGGRYDFTIHNFYGSQNREALYGVSGAGRAFEFHAGIYVPIETGMGAADKPLRVFEIANHLGLIYPGGSIQLSAPGEPMIFDAIVGAAEIGFGTDITDVVQSNESAVAIFGKQKIGTLSGRDAASFQLSELTEEAGSLAWTAQRLGRTVYIDARGLRDLAATNAYGNFRAGSLLSEMTSYFAAKAKAGVSPVFSYVVKSKSQYRVLYSDGTGLTVFMGRKAPEACLFTISPLSLTCCATGEFSDGEAILAGGAEGYVYRLDSGTSLDGAGVQAFVMPASNHLRSPMIEKRLHKTTIELDAGVQASVGVTVFFDYGADGQPISGSRDFTARGSTGKDFLVQAGGGLWDAATWDEFFWSAPLRGYVEAYTEGIGVNFTPIFACDAHPAEPSHTLQAYTFHWSARKLRR